MALLETASPLLRRSPKLVKEITPAIREVIVAMRKEMVVAGGVGLAANQIGEDWQIFVIDQALAQRHGVPDAYINPAVLEYSLRQSEAEEGCLSIPGYFRPIKRAQKIKLKALDEEGNKLKLKARGMLARVFQHEVDHLNGKLIKDYDQV